MRLDPARGQHEVRIEDMPAIWKALESVEPRVVVLEFNAACGPERTMTISYQPDFRLDFSVQPYRCGASLPAFASW